MGGAIYSFKVLYRWGDTSLNREFLQSLSFWACKIAGVKIETIHAERVNQYRPAVLIGNHQSGMDLAIMGSLCPTNTVIIGKREILYIPFVGWYFLGAGNLLINRSKTRQARAALFGVIETLKKKKLNLGIMPEGTRNRVDTGTLLPFKKGAFNLAIEAQLPIMAVVCSDLKGIAIWEKNELKGGKVILSVLGPFMTTGLSAADANRLSQEIWQQMDAELKRITALVRT